MCRDLNPVLLWAWSSPWPLQVEQLEAGKEDQAGKYRVTGKMQTDNSEVVGEYNTVSSTL